MRGVQQAWRRQQRVDQSGTDGDDQGQPQPEGKLPHLGAHEPYAFGVRLHSTYLGSTHVCVYVYGRYDTTDSSPSPRSYFLEYRQGHKCWSASVAS